MKKALSLLAATMLAIGSLHAGGSDWLTNFDDALAAAAKENRPVLMDFTGSDWCGWCIRLDKETFSKPEWKKFASNNVVLMEVDFPNNKPQSDELKAQNAELNKKFGVDGFPTLILVDSKGREITRHVGYLQGGPDALIDWIKANSK